MYTCTRFKTTDTCNCYMLILFIAASTGVRVNDYFFPINATTEEIMSRKIKYASKSKSIDTNVNNVK